jgi:hypothetical protein
LESVTHVPIQGRTQISSGRDNQLTATAISYQSSTINHQLTYQLSAIFTNSSDIILCLSSCF